MRQVRRYGVELDVCPNSGGVWLDNGELERLIALVRDEGPDTEASRFRRARHPDGDDDDADARAHRKRRPRSRPRGARDL
jgi:Zn-finger nucleic acid-binding protein